MCGIVGFIGQAKVDPDKFKLLLLYNESRGKDSSGIYIEQENKTLTECLIKKTGLTSTQLLPTLVIPESELVIAHTRAATYGVINVENAHPFVFKHMVGVHNGKVSNIIDLRTKYNYTFNDVTVDSMIFYKYMSDNDDYKVLNEYNGAAALLFSKSDEKLYAYHDKERPLFKGTIKYQDGSKGYYFSSLKESLQAIECVDIKELTEELLHIYKKDGTCEIKKIKRTPYSEPPKVYNNTYSNVYSNKQTHVPAVSPTYADIKKPYTVNLLQYPAKSNESPYNRILKNNFLRESVYTDNNGRWIKVDYDNGLSLLHKLNFTWEDGTPKNLVVTLTRFNCSKIYKGNKVYYVHVDYNDGGYEELFVKSEIIPAITPNTSNIPAIKPTSNITGTDYTRNCIDDIEFECKSTISKLIISDKLVHSFMSDNKQYLLNRVDANEKPDLLDYSESLESPFVDDETNETNETIKKLINYQDDEYWEEIFNPNREDPDDYSPIDKSLDDVDFNVTEDAESHALIDIIKDVNHVKTKTRGLLTYIENKGAFKSANDLNTLENKVVSIYDELNSILTKSTA